jgi:ferritin-like metal-binding protein YciE
MSFHSLKDLYVDQLRDLYDAEQQITQAMPKMIKASSSPDLRQTFQKHLDETRFQVERLDLIFKKLGEAPQGRHCRGIAGIIEEGDELIQTGGAPDVSDAALIASAQRVEHYEIAAYGCVRTFADRLEVDYAAGLLQQTLDEEEAADESLTSLAEGGINQSAGEGKEIHGSRLAYVSRDHVRGSESFSDVRVVGGANDDLGSVDGFVVDRSSGRPYYVVVDSGGWFAGGRYLLPVNSLNFDRPAKRMRARLDKDTIKRYPKFDGDAFESPGEGHQYERRLLETYAPGSDIAGTRSETWNYEDYEQFRQPEWWITEGVAMTRGRVGQRGGPSHDRSPASTVASERTRDSRNPTEPAAGDDWTSSEGRSTIDEPRGTNRGRSRPR